MPRMLVPEDFKGEAEYKTPRRIAVLGSSGSIGCSTLDVVRQNPKLFQVDLISAHKNSELLLKQIAEFSPAHAVVTDLETFELVKKLSNKNIATKIHFGDQALVSLLSEIRPELVVAAIVGMAGLPGVLKALELGSTVALANKESLVVAGELVSRSIEAGRGAIIPVDSEHSAIFQCLRGSRRDDLHSLVLTASGGPFLNTPLEQFSNITVKQALNHPKWKMGAKITVDSASMMNKALELIEAHWLFGVSAEQISVVVHPQSIVHSCVKYKDGSMIAQLSYPDMKGPIAYALSYPAARLSDIVRHLDLEELGKLEFQKLDNHKFPGVNMARACVEAGGGASAVFNLANEWAVARFLEERVRFIEINRIVEDSLTKFSGVKYATLEDLFLLRDELIGWLNKQAWS